MSRRINNFKSKFFSLSNGPTTRVKIISYWMKKDNYLIYNLWKYIVKKNVPLTTLTLISSCQLIRKKRKHSIGKWAKLPNRNFKEKETCMVYNKHMKSCIASSVIRETQHTRSQWDFISHTDLKITFLGGQWHVLMRILSNRNSHLHPVGI